MRLRLLAAAAAVCALASSCGQKPASLDVSPKRVKIYGLQRSQRLTARVLDRKGQPVIDAGSPNWSSSRPDVVEVDSAGRLTSKRQGKVLVTVSLGALSTQVAVDVVDAKSVEVVPPTLRLLGPPGTPFPLHATVKNSLDRPVPLPISWSSSDEKVALVSQQGLVTSVAAGTVLIIVKLGDLQSAAEVTVDPRPVGRVELLPATALVHVGDSQHYQVAVYAPDGKPIEGASARFFSSDPSVATVDGAGVASGLKAGATTIRAQVADRAAESTLLVN